MDLWITLVLILAAILSFVLFLIYRKKYSGLTASAVKLAWAGMQYAVGMGFLWIHLPLWLKGDFKNIALLSVIVPYAVTGLIMTYLIFHYDRTEKKEKKSRTNIRKEMKGGIL